MESAFLQFLGKYGKDVTIHYRTEKIDPETHLKVKNKEGHQSYDEEEIPTICYLDLDSATTRYIEGTVVQVIEDTAQFKLSDAPNLNTNSFLVYTDTKINQEHRFKISQLKTNVTHIHAQLERVEPK